MLKKQFTNGWVQTPNSIINHELLSFKAKGLWTYINSKPEGWDFAVWRITKETREGDKSIRSGLNELVKAGYLQYKPKFDDDNQLNGQDYILSDEPFGVLQDSVHQNRVHGNGGHNNKTVTNKKLLIKHCNSEKIKEFFEKEDLKEIVQSKLIPYANQVWWDKQAEITLATAKEGMIKHFAKKEIKDIKTTFINWILKINRNQFYKYPEKQFTPSTTSYKLPERENTNSDLVDIYQDENETLDEFELRVRERESLTGNNYRKHYTAEAGANNDYLAMKQQLIAKMSFD
jgi:hypothetical protein